MEIKLTRVFLFPISIGFKRKLLLNIMRTMVFLFCLSVFSITPNNVLSQNAKIVIDQNKTVTVDEVFDLIMSQTDYTFIYQVNMFENFPKVVLEKGTIHANKLLTQSLSKGNYNFEFTDKNTIVIKEVPLMQQELIITGKVTDVNGVPLGGATVINLNSLQGLSADFAGNYSIKAKNGDVLAFLYLGYLTQKITIDSNTNIDVKLAESFDLLDEVVILGYQTTTKRLTTGAVSKISGSDISIQPIANPILALQGRSTGLNIMNPNGSIGSMPEVQIRGVGTLTGQNQPLYIMDGVILPNQSQVATTALQGRYNGIQGISPFNTINPNDIESVEVLKDADATAIYGSRGSNGVIIITTKKGKQGEVKFNLDFSTGVTHATAIPKRLNTQQYLQLRRDAFAMGNYNPTNQQAINPIVPTASNAPDLVNPLWSQDAYTDWGDYEYGNSAFNNNFQANASGGSKSLSFYSSLGFTRNEDITLFNPYQKTLSGLVKLNHTSANDRLNIRFSNSLSQSILRPSTGGTGQSHLSFLPPNMPSFYPDGKEYWPEANIAATNIRNFLTNPSAGQYIIRDNKTLSVISNIDISYEVAKNLTAKVQLGYNNQNFDFSSKTTSRAIDPFGNPQLPTKNDSQNIYESINIEPQLSYFTKIGKGKLDILTGITFFQKNNDIYSIALSGFDSDLLMDSWSAAAQVFSRTSSYTRYNFNSVFARLGYNWDDKYIINGSFRRDGSSRFGPNNKWGNFGSVGAAWIFSKESFLKNSTVLSHGKLRGSYGATGNDQINDFRFTSLFSATGTYDGASILNPDYLANPNFKWEETTKRDLALELGFFKDRILLNVNWFRNLSTDLLTNQSIPSQTGFSNFLDNFPGVIENTGWEFELTTNNLSPTSSVNWKTFFNLSFLDNTLIKYPDLPNSPNANTLEIGRPVPNPRYPLDIERPWVFLGIDSATGQPILEDIDGNGSISASGFLDRRWYGSSIPSFQGGFTNSLSYGGFTLDVFIQFSKQFTTNHLYGTLLAGQLFNPVADYAGNYWTKPGDESKYPRLYTGLNNLSSSQSRAALTQYLASTAAIEEVFYARLKNVSLSYTFPKQLASKLKLDNLSIYVKGQNLFTYVNKELYKDPEMINFFTKGFIPMVFNYGASITF